MSVEATFHFSRTEPVKEKNTYAEGVLAINIVGEAYERLKRARDAAAPGTVIELVSVEINQSHKVPDDE